MSKENLFYGLLAPKGFEKLLRTHLWAQLLFALVFGVLCGYGLLFFESEDSGSWVRPLADWVALPGSIFLAAIQMIIVPLVLTSIILALSGISKNTNAKTLGVIAVMFVVVSTIIAAFIGVFVTGLLEPGSSVREAMDLGLASGDIISRDKFVFSPETVMKFIPTNPLASLLKGDLLEVLIISLIFGIVMSQMEERLVSPLKEFLAGTQGICLRIIALAMMIAPYAVFGLMVRAVVNTGSSVLFGMFGYLLCVFLGFLCMASLYGLWLALFLRSNPFRFVSDSREALLMAFSLSSSAATMPTTLKVAHERLKLDDELSQLLIPLGTTINMAGSAVWQTSATLFLAQAFGSELHFSSILLVVALSVGASIGTPGVPGAGLGVLTSTLKSVGVPSTGIPLILGVDRLVDMGCTVINVMGDLVMCMTAQWVVKHKKLESRDTE